MNTFESIKQIKECFRNGNSLLIDELKDSYEARKYIYRLVRREIVDERSKSNHYVHYVLNPYSNAIINNAEL